MRTQILATVVLSSISAQALIAPRLTLNGPCTGASGVIGVCVPTASCTRDGGSYITNACPDTPDDIKCCTKPSCQLEAQKGDCRWAEQCGGGKPILRDLCPGPDAFRCCITNGQNETSAVTPSQIASVTSNVTESTIPSASTDATGTSILSVVVTSKPEPSTTSKKIISTKTTPKSTAKPTPTTNLGEKILKKAEEKEGVPYHWAGGSCKGATGGGFDCSGLVSWAVCQVTGRDLFSEGLRVTRVMYCANEKKLKYKKIKFADRRAGDAVFFGGKCDCENNPEGIHHVGLMMDDEYTMWNALKTGTNIRKDNFKSWDESACPYVIRFE